MKFIAPLILTTLLILVAYFGTAVLHLEFLFGVVIPYAAFALFLGGFVYRIVSWARSPVPYRIPTTSGQGKSLAWIKYDRFESPFTLSDVLGRMALEILLFRSLFRNTAAQMQPGPKLKYFSAKWLWLGALVFHWAMLIIVLRHYRFFLEPAPFFVGWIDTLDGLMEITLPTFYLTDLLLLIALIYLLFRRFVVAPMRYLSLAQDYFPLYLILAIAGSGILMRYGFKTDLMGVKALVQSLLHFQAATPSGISALFYVHLFLVCVLTAYFPYSKLMHMGGVFFSPTRNQANNSRAVRHKNPVNPEIKKGSYKDYETQFKDKLTQSGIPLD
ncbi:MAG: sulfate reduction electron transfer complex DsrMKJOP subunit DsrM [Deltaproteobacteria bacterium]|nr:sulfate reduction electron transfer complex DsrMKJOP subunit DsrM [Deltaproteobacteria bacterium]